MSHLPGAGHCRIPWFGIAAALVLVGMAVLGPNLLSIDPLAQDLGAAFAPPGKDWLFGADYLGRSVLARLVAAAPLSLGVAAISSIATAAIGTAVGLAAATIGGTPGRVVMAVADAIYAVPGLLLVLLVGGLFGGGIAVVTTGLVLARWPLFTRTCYPLARAALAAPDAEASRLLGFDVLYCIRRHAWPAVRPTVTSLATLGVGANVLAVSSLGFIGIGLAPPRPEWGAMVADSLPFMRDSPLALLAPVGALFLATLACTLIGEALAEPGSPISGDTAEQAAP
jgi:peptide/nickel transport system permease protein